MDSSPSSTPSPSAFPPIVELNVGGVFYTTSLSTLTREDDSLLAQMFTGKCKSHPVVKDTKGRYFLDRDGVLFRYVLDYLRNQKLILPENFHERDRLRHEAEYFRLGTMVKCVNSSSSSSSSASQGHQRTSTPVNSALGSVVSTNNVVVVDGRSGGGGSDVIPGVVTLGYRGTFAFGRDGLADVKFRKLSRILVSGRVNLCREVFGDTLNESRDPDRGTADRYTSRFFLKHSYLEQALDMLHEAGFRLVGCMGSGTNSSGELKPGMDNEENKWQHYNEFIFLRAC